MTATSEISPAFGEIVSLRCLTCACADYQFAVNPRRTFSVPSRCPENAKSLKSRVSSAVEQRFCKPLVGSSILSPGTNKIGHFMHEARPSSCCSVSQTFLLRFNDLQRATATPCDMVATWLASKAPTSALIFRRQFFQPFIKNFFGQYQRLSAAFFGASSTHATPERLSH
jgi:hypothetical protein